MMSIEEPLPAAFAARNQFAFPVAVIDAAADHFGVCLAAIARLHAGALFHARDALANVLDDGLGFGDHLVLADGAGTGFGIAFTPISCVVLLPALAAVDGPRTLVVFGDPFVTTDGTGLGRTGGRGSVRGRLLVILGPCEQGRRGQDAARQQGNAIVLPHDAFSLCMRDLPILAEHRDASAGQDRATHEVGWRLQRRWQITYPP